MIFHILKSGKYKTRTNPLQAGWSLEVQPDPYADWYPVAQTGAIVPTGMIYADHHFVGFSPENKPTCNSVATSGQKFPDLLSIYFNRLAQKSTCRDFAYTNPWE